MGRLVEPKPVGGALFSVPPGDGAKEAAERIAKYVPAEVLAGYLGIVNLVESGWGAGTTARSWGLGVAVLVGLVFTPLYLNQVSTPGKPKRLHIAVGTASFLLWSYAMKGFWAEQGLHSPTLAGILVIVFTLFTGLLSPSEGSK